MKRKHVARLLAGLGAGVLMAGGCRTILGIDEPVDYDECEADGGDACDAGVSGEGGNGGNGGIRGESGMGGDEATAGAAGAEGTLTLTPTVGEVGEPCGEEGAFACEGYASRVQLLCRDGEWERTGSCGSTERCDTRASEAGLCNPVVDECVGESPGFSFCREGERFECGVDLVTTTLEEECEHTCLEGACTECMPGSLRCVEDSQQTCADDGSWGEATPCPAETPVCAGTECALRSCEALPSTCGADADESCCEWLLVDGGETYTMMDPAFAGSQPATVSDFGFDKFEVTVGRFRNFKEAWDGGWRPAEGAGKHDHVNDGQGVEGEFGGNELGWQTAWDEEVDVRDATLFACIDANAPSQTPESGITWTYLAGDNENHPINCVSWYEALAFCIWDDGFLPTEAEWQYAATGGMEERLYPWPSTAADDIDHDRAVYGQPDEGPERVGTKPLGEGRWGQADLSGNVSEWVLDRGYNYEADLCVDCASLPTTASPIWAEGFRVHRGGGFPYQPPEEEWLQANRRAAGLGDARAAFLGFRCARSPVVP